MYHRNLSMFVALAAVPLLMIAAGNLPIAAAVKPNLVLVLADDLGWKDVGYQGNGFCETPNIDRLARQGMVFSNGDATARAETNTSTGDRRR